MVMFKKIKSFEVVFNDPEKVYGSGEKVAGRVIVEVCEVTRVKAVRILACGVAKVLWMQGSQQCKQTSEYLRYEDTLLLEDQPTGENEMVIMRPGNKYEYKFGFELPQGPLGTSFKGKYGCVDYWVKAFLDRPSQPTQETKKVFEVMDMVDVNTPDLMAPVSAKKEKKVSCMFIPDGQVSVSARIDRKGFCEGDEISIHADFENTCSRIVVPKAAIVARHTYLANGQTKVLTQKLSSVRGNHIISGTCASWRGKSLRVQKIRPSILGCNILRVEYSLLIYVSVPGSKKVILDLPLVIGSRSGLSSRTSSMASRTSSEMSWVDLNIPDTPEGEPDLIMSRLLFWPAWVCEIVMVRHFTARLLMPMFFLAPPCYMDIIPEDHRLESPTTPLLDDTDGSQDSPIFMYAPEFKFMPPPTYTEVRIVILPLHLS
ncbi:thioredoxin-interacting protein isoform X1 [Ursus arctos]|uniref:thioredoxin-interacting protein isoform X1 n=1 Tax=Ursus arctos TaxID=9644 RepID=UPI002548D656|nr:thioredoxin-interacting protein isoform X1 [Ursus arctos]